MENRELQITQHAVDRFVERCRKNLIPVPRDPHKTIMVLLRMSKEDEVDPVQRVKRLIKHGHEVSYLECQGWRFVIDEGRSAVITVERKKNEQN